LKHKKFNDTNIKIEEIEEELINESLHSLKYLPIKNSINSKNNKYTNYNNTFRINRNLKLEDQSL